MGSADQPLTPDPLVGELFPFHLLLTPGDELVITSTGETLARWLDRPLVGRPFADVFDVVRPATTTLDTDFVATRRSSVFILGIVDDHRQLRGQMVTLDSGQILFIGSPVLSAVGTIDEIGLSMSDFAPHDATLDLIVLQRFSQMQVADLEQQADELRDAMAERDRYNLSAHTDMLTGLPNRRAFWDECEKAFGLGVGVALLFIDVDQFKSVNDLYGHAAGDMVLRAIARRLTEAVRSTELVARLGGDEFAVLVKDSDELSIRRMIDRLVGLVSAPVDLEGPIVRPSVSIGVVMDAHEREVDTLIQRADLAMYEGRREGRGNVTWFVERMRTEREEERALVDDLEAAVDHGGIVCAFQPIVRLSDQRVDAVEALARWQHPERGPVPPADFVPLAESAGLVERLDQRMLERSLAQVEQWRAGGRELAVHVNVSGRSIRHDLPQRIAVALAAVRLPAEALAIEVTESWLIRNELEVAEILAEVAGLGVRIHLDDFGTGYSSMAHIYALPIWGLKIDRSFVLDALQSERSRRLIAATIGMAHSLDLEVIAEGVETQAVADILCDLGCDYAQGYLYAPPRPGHELTKLLARPPWSRPEA